MSVDQELEALVEAARAGDMKPVYLFSGDEFLCKRAVDALVEALVPEAARDFNLSVLDGALVDARRIAADLSQVPMLRGTKVVVVRDTTLLSSKGDLSAEVERAMRLFADGKRGEGARRMLAVLAKAKWTVEALTEASRTRWKKDLGVDAEALDPEVLEAIRQVIEAEGWSVPETDAQPLERLLGGDAPAGSVLVLTCEKPDRRSPLTRLIEERGVHLKCAVERRGRDIEGLDIRAVTRTILAEHEKRLEPEAERALKRAIGGDLRLIAAEVEKLCLYVGDRPTITRADVEAVGVSQIREEEFWELGNAVVGRDLTAALFYLDDAFAHGRHPIAIVAAIAGALRRALQVRAAAEAAGVAPGRRLRRLPDAVLESLAELRGKKPHPYAALKEWERSLGWPSVDALGAALGACARADQALKRSGGVARLVVEALVFELCRGARVGTAA